VAFIINVTDPVVAHEMLEKLPLGKAHMMSFELIPIGPLNPLRFFAGHAAETLRYVGPYLDVSLSGRRNVVIYPLWKGERGCCIQFKAP
jgi:hypothetical protein